MADKLTWLEKRQKDRSVLDARKDARPQDAHTR